MNLKFFDNSPRIVEEYYDRSQRWYTLIYSDSKSLALHFGIWDEHSRSKKEALINQYKEIVALLKPSPKDLILDAGCGVGGASIWLAENTEAELVGITLSTVQLRLAQKYALTRGVDHKTKFRIDNYFRTGFSDKMLNKVFGIESFCYSYPEPERAFSEMYRILKPGGSMVIVDGFLQRYPQNKQEIQLATDFCHGVKMSGWCTKDEIIAAMEKSGFTNIGFKDKTGEVLKSVRNVYRLGLFTYPFLLLLKLLGLASQIEADNYLFTRSQKELYNLGLVGYGIFYAEKG